ncbi:hypothetical protein [Rathayibacter iranicus]|uniref:Pectate lyase superfamily protein domain-containing protein n=2 Tax=Rathayibacter iranicus TaxID=59737 RepID=A0AAD1AI42_9MICO|nr:hypothetical protein [Rathayibacter iranicus]AZZ57159.1 hypothetical protein C7V51_15740 [Rathayibacter iranicus]MWV29792.1 hypothetical protein [Rathayibacter iranicus NCPPB 2253 = VKM Ac-1602]PPI41401.1 hypothetical protein C5E09_14600 [Rathayibacter iranicus]PPI57429.1 hypothetical protein C5E08_15490 [Rathayibacter iranicus]PPI68296.1 hypothetical protein C5E01_14545 [Rathayibacter iranicus]
MSDTSTATNDSFVRREEVGAAGGVAPLSDDKKLPVANHPDRVLTTNGGRPVGKGELTLNVSDFGTLGTADDSATIQAAIDEATAAGLTPKTAETGETVTVNGSSAWARVMLRPGIYRANITLRAGVEFVGMSGTSARFGIDSYRYGGVVIRSADPSKPVITIDGAATALSSVTIVGEGSGIGLHVRYGFETRVDGVRIINFEKGLWISQTNNALYNFIRVDNCGSAATPAVVIESNQSHSGDALATNTADFNSLHIERAKGGTSLAVAVGNRPNYDAAEFLRFVNLHIEASTDSGGVANPNNVPVIDLGNVRGVDFVAAFVFGGPGPLLRMNQQVLNTSSGFNGGVSVVGGTWLGQGPSNNLFVLARGNGFHLGGGARLTRYTGAAVFVSVDFGPVVSISDPQPLHYASGSAMVAPGPILSDQRPNTATTRRPYDVQGDLRIWGHETVVQPTAPTFTLSGNGATFSGGGSDSRGTILLQVANGATAAFTGAPGGVELGRVTFAQPWSNAPHVAVTPASADAVEAGIWANATPTQIILFAKNGPSGATSAKLLRITYSAVGTVTG